MVKLEFPQGVKHNPAYWLNPAHLWVSRRKFLRRDNSNAWRQSFLGVGLPRHPDRSVPFSEVLGDRAKVRRSFRIVILGDSGEGDRSQYGLVPLIRALEPDWMIINGDVAYPAGRDRDFEIGLFRPYRNLGVPIWATPGNHEYYSGDKGRTFFQTFCTFRYASRWAQHGLPLVPQPGTYWEVKEPGTAADVPRLTVIGLDTGMKGNLDGIGLGKSEDHIQHSWLRERLEEAEREERAAIVLFHIPALVDERDQGVHLDRLHQIIARSKAPRLVVCGHIHNHQVYRPATFRRFLEEARRTVPADPDRPHYVVTGGGGAYTSEPRRGGPYPADLFFPEPAEWTDHARLAERVVAASGLGRAAASRIAGAFGSSARKDEDSAKFLSLVLVDVKPGSVEARHILMRDLRTLYTLPAGTVVRVDDPEPPIDPGRLADLLRDDTPSKRETIRLVP